MSVSNSVRLSDHTFSTILLDAIQFFPQTNQQIHSETNGLLFGKERKGMPDIDYVFPMGNVLARTEASVFPDCSVAHAVQSARKLISTSQCMGMYHSHPYDELFGEAANPSNGDVLSAGYINEPYLLIIGLSRNQQVEQPLRLEYRDGPAYEFSYRDDTASDAMPDGRPLDRRVVSIHGSFQKYQFVIRCYYYNGATLQDIDVFSTEADTLMRTQDGYSHLNTFITEDMEQPGDATAQSRDEWPVEECQASEYALHKLKNIKG
ncbi:hypothetical protein [Tuberibacillus sp. Marseille-P3662]|uniref:hypothetical protein n=1 Tax=Tuberibacillus sp. Marseille-P3662 TaxID=1965358 RepID=UPI000A1CA24D|nr:hypothetical protein [Tuberibacillus sp. Marseille-P3662]